MCNGKTNNIMAQLNYKRRLENLQNRKADPLSNFKGLSESFERNTLPENVKYLMESMRPIDEKYNSATKQASDNVKSHLERELNVSFSRNYRNQGSVMTNTNIKLYSDIDLLAIIGGYHYLAPALLPSPNPYLGNPYADIIDLRKQSTEILKRQYDDVDTTGKKSIAIFNKNLRRKVDVVFSFWYNTSEFQKTTEEYYRGIYLFDFEKSQQILDYPFAHILNVNSKGNNTSDGSRKGIRLLKSLKVDSDINIDLNSFQLTTIVHSISNVDLIYYKGREIDIAEAISEELYKLITNNDYRRSIVSPNGTEHPLHNSNCIPELSKLKIDLDQLIRDCKAEFTNYYSKQAILNY